MLRLLSHKTKLYYWCLDPSHTAMGPVLDKRVNVPAPSSSRSSSLYYYFCDRRRQIVSAQDSCANAMCLRGSCQCRLALLYKGHAHPPPCAAMRLCAVHRLITPIWSVTLIINLCCAHSPISAQHASAVLSPRSQQFCYVAGCLDWPCMEAVGCAWPE